MPRKKGPPKKASSIVLFKPEASRAEDNFDPDPDIDFEDYLDSQERLLLHVFDNSMRSRLQLATIQIMLLSVCALLGLHFFGWIAALAIGVLLGALVIMSLIIVLSDPITLEDVEDREVDEKSANGA